MTLAQRCARLPVGLRRSIALVVVPAILLALVAALCAPVIRASSAQRAWRIEAAKLIAQSKGAEELRAQLSQRISMMRGSWQWSKLYESAAGGVTASLLHSDITVLLSQTQSQAQSMTVVPAQAGRFFTKIGVRFTASMRIDQLQRLVSAVAAHPRYLRIERLTIAAPQSQRENENPPLAVTAEIYGFERRAWRESFVTAAASSDER